MSKRKFSVSYSSLRRQVKAQVDSDMQFIACNFGSSSSESDHDITRRETLHVSAGQMHQLDVCETDDSNVSAGICRGDGDRDSSTLALESVTENDFDDCHWVDSDSDNEHGSGQLDIISRQLSDWAVTHSVNHSAVGALLGILKPHFPLLPSDARTLLRTPRSCDVRLFKNGGEYCHLGLEKGLKELLANIHTSDTKHIELQFNIDGLPLFKSSSTSLWPILCMLKHPFYREPFVVGVYYGSEKPASASEFLEEFVAEAAELLKNGITVADVQYSVKIHSFVCDAPARAFVKGVKCHSGYAACEKCTEHGEYIGKVILPGTNSPLRTDESFDDMLDEDHHMGPCPLKPLSIGCVSQFGLDYMHMVCLGVVRRLLLYWKGPTGPLQVRLGSRAVSELSQKLLALSHHIPCDFARRPRSVTEVLRWKATEFRQFLLYTGSVVLRDVLPKTLFQHFMLLSVAITILACPKFASSFCDYANDLLVLFVSEAERLYGKEMYVYNVHCLIHLASDVKNLGTVDEFSAFPFENKLGQLKKMIRKPQYVLQQLVFRLAEKQQFRPELLKDHLSGAPVLKTEHINGPLLSGYRSYRPYRWLQTDKYVIALSVGNNCVFTSDGNPVLVKNILESNGTITLLYEKFVTVEDDFTYPLPSSKLGIYKVSGQTSTDLFVLPIWAIAQKGVMLPLDVHEDNFLVLPLLH
jgi:hypothetical protein